MKRRGFLKFGVIGGFLSSTISYKLIKDVQKTFSIGGNDGVLWQEKIFPRGLKTGSKVAITAPASPTSLWELRNTTRALKRMGLKVVIGDSIKKHDRKYRYFSASDTDRAEEFMKYILSPEIDCILTGRGGYGVMRILPLLDYDAIKRNPKIIIGFSDITALLIAIYIKTGLVTFHGPVGVATYNSFTIKYFKDVLFQNQTFEPIIIKNSSYRVINEGIAFGTLIGGNLTLITATLGTPFEINTENTILFIEDVSTEPYQVDRMLTQLWLAGKFEKCNGVVFGKFIGLDRRKNFYPVKSFTMRQVIYARMKELGIPSIIGMEIGHLKNKITMPIGTIAKLDAKKKTLILLEKSVDNC